MPRKSWLTQALDIFDFDQRKLVQPFTVPQDLSALGASVSNAYYLHGYRKGGGQLWRVKSDNSALDAVTGSVEFWYDRLCSNSRKNSCTHTRAVWPPGGSLPYPYGSRDASTVSVVVSVGFSFWFAVVHGNACDESRKAY